MARAKRVVLWVAGFLIVVGIVASSFGWWWLSSLYRSEQVDSARASAEFATIRAQFTGISAAFEIRTDRLVVVRQPAESASASAASAHLLLWDPSLRTLSRVTLPFSLSAVATEPLPLEALLGVANQGLGALMEAKRRGNELGIRISDLERYGRTLLLDSTTSDGRQVLMWSE
jgi:hypothetical protein